MIVNRSKFGEILESIVHYATDTSDASVEKVAFSVLNKMVVIWSAPSPDRSAGGGIASDTEFQDIFGQFVIEHLSRVCFEVPSKSTFNSNDAQSRLVNKIPFSFLTSKVLAEIGDRWFKNRFSK